MILTPQTKRILKEAKQKSFMMHRNGVCMDILFDAFIEDLSLSCESLLEKYELISLLSDASEDVMDTKKANKYQARKLTPKVKKFLTSCEKLSIEINSKLGYVPPEIIFLGFFDKDFMPKALRQLDEETVDNIISEITFSLNDMDYGDILTDGMFSEEESEEVMEAIGGGSLKRIHPLFEENEVLSQFAKNLNVQALNGEFDKIIDFDKKIPEIVTVLCRKKKPNVILTGLAGTGKTSLVEYLANKIAKGEAPSLLSNKVIYSVNLSSMVAGTQFRGQFEQRLEDFVNEAKKYDNVILFIDEIHTLIGAGGASSQSLEASNILKPELARGTISCIGATTTEEYNLTIKKDSALDRRFERITVREPSKKQMGEIIPTLISYYESFHKVKYSHEFCSSIIEYCDKFIPNKRYPDKAVDVIDHCGAQCKVKHWALPEETHKKNAKVFKDAQKMNVNEKERDKLFEEIADWKDKKSEETPFVEQKELDIFFQSKMNPIFSNKVLGRVFEGIDKDFIGNEKIIKKFKKELELANFSLAFSAKQKPLVFCFNGGKDSGKSHLLSLLSDRMANCGINIISYNGINFSDDYAPYKIISNHANSGSLAENVTVFPNSVIFIDDFEETHTSAFSLFEQIFKEGRLKTSGGDCVDFSNCLFIVSSDTHSSKTLGFNSKKQEPKSLVSSEISGFFHKSFFLDELDDGNLESILLDKLESIKTKLKIKGVKLRYSSGFYKNVLKSNSKEVSASEVSNFVEEDIFKYVHDQISDGKTLINLDKMQKTS